MNPKNEPHDDYFKCSCQHCNGHIAFDAKSYKVGERNKAECPHCGMETVLFIPSANERITAPKQGTTTKSVSNAIQKSFLLFVVAFALGIVACLVCCPSILGAVSIPVAALTGFLLTAAALINFERNKSAGQVFAITGAIICFFSILIYGFGQFNQSHTLANIWKTHQKSDSSILDAFKREWATSANARQGDMEITVSDVAIRRLVAAVDSDSAVRSTNLCISLLIKNTSSTNLHHYISWSEPQTISALRSAKLTDVNGNIYKKVYFSFLNSQHDEEQTLYPNQVLTDTLAFEIPVKNIRLLYLELPSERFGGTGMIRFQIPTSRIEIKGF